ncbi:MAG: right-handed parallel beta-helix repeat-containing protein, partial [Clostridia bacterium]|nr:right-handed parallel beta-helix repeat-containing protein [Clostridia bacterium]
IFADDICAAVTITGNRIEWNRNGGINLVNTSLLNVTGNYFDRAYGPAVKLVGGWIICNNITFTGNIFNRNGRYEGESVKCEDSCHLYLENCNNITAAGNTFVVGKDDFGEAGGGVTPQYGVVYKKLNSCYIAGNTMFNGFTKAPFLDLGECFGENVIKDNPSR